MENLETRLVPFMGADLMAARDGDGQVWAGVSYICKGIGLSKNEKDRQVRNIQADRTLSRACVKFAAGVFDPNNETIAVKLDYVPLWLAKINITPAMEREKPELADRLEQYQTKAKDVLAAAFLDPSYAGSTQPQPTSAECLQAIAELRRLGMADDASVRRILKQGGFDVDELAIQPGGVGSDPGCADAFLADILPRAAWERLPFPFLEELYPKWMARHRPGVAPLGRNTFISRVKLLAGQYGWVPMEKQWRPGKKGKKYMQGLEPLAIEYGIPGWYDPSKLPGKARYRGIRKIGS